MTARLVVDARDPELRKVAAAALVDPRTVVRALASGGKLVRSQVTRLAIVKALRELGFVREARELEGKVIR